MECWSAPRCPLYPGVWLYGVLICSAVSLIPRSMAIWSVDLLRGVPYTKEYGYMECWSAPWCPLYRGVWLYGVFTGVLFITKSDSMVSRYALLQNLILKKHALFLAKILFWTEEHTLLDQTIVQLLKICGKCLFFIEYSVTPSLYKNSREEKTTAARALWPSTVQYNSSLMQILSRVTQVGQIN